MTDHMTTNSRRNPASTLLFFSHVKEENKQNANKSTMIAISVATSLMEFQINVYI